MSPTLDPTSRHRVLISLYRGQIKRLQNEKLAWCNSKALVLIWEQRLEIRSVCPMAVSICVHPLYLSSPTITPSPLWENTVLIPWSCLHLGMDLLRRVWHCKWKPCLWHRVVPRGERDGQGRAVLVFVCLREVLYYINILDERDQWRKSCCESMGKKK